MKYDPTNAALTRPQSQPPLVMDENWPIDAVCAEFSRLAYFEQTGTTMAEAMARVGFGTPQFFASEDRGWWKIGSAGFGTVDRDGHAIIAFRGTQIDTPWDILIDLGIWPRRWPGAGRVHDGFWKALRSILGQVETWLADPAIKRLTVTGHSLGAAMATLLAGLQPDAELVTFGSPLVGNRAFADAFVGRRVRRYVDTIDFVTAIPPVYYRHLKGLHFIDPDGVVRFPGAGPTKADVAKAIADYARCGRDPLKNALSRRFADHAPINYVGAVLGGRTGPS